MDDVEHMRRALAQAATVRSTTAPNPWVGSVVVPPGSGAGRRDGVRRSDGASRRAPRRGGRPGRGGRGRPGSHALRDARALRPPGSHAALHRRHHRGGRGPGRGRHRGPRRTGRRPRHRRAACRRPGGHRGSGRRRGGRAAGSLLQAPDDGAALGGAQDGRQPRRPHGGAGRHQPLDHRRGGAPGRPPAAVPLRRRARRGRAPSGRTTPSSPSASTTGSSASSPCVSCSAGPRPAPRCARRSSCRAIWGTC